MYQCRLIVCMTMISLLLIACATANEPPPIGSEPTGPTTYPVTVSATTLKFLSSPQDQTQNGLEISLHALDTVPQLYYRYQMASKVNGTYLVFMIKPPKLYSVYRVPFYKNDPDRVIVKVELTNHSAQILDTANAVCAFELDGQTVVTQPLKAGDLLPDQTKVVPVQGPSLEQLKGHEELAVWIFQPSSANAALSKTPFKWTLHYTLTVETEAANAILVAQSPYESGVSNYAGRIEPANSDTTSTSDTAKPPPIR